ncbi:MAG TPA: DUF2786 domain-containing protein [Acidimicrobiales bacterium]|nr:DUF2786 domain-containing protein [Acidimicrobiales bacterium]
MAHLDAHGAGSTPDPGVLHKVRSLLAKAESTTFPDEAEALSAKAQQLMDRHAIDRAMLAAAGGGDPTPEGRTLVVESPYARPKFQLLSELARANRCRAVWSTRSREATVIGFPDDQATVELLYTSLLVQGTRAMLAAGTGPDSRSRSFRHSFLVAYAARIGQRLRAAAAATVREAAEVHGEALLPVLASREVAVDEHLADAFPHLRTMRVTARDPAGYAAGHAAADRARLGGAEVGGRARRLGR